MNLLKKLLRNLQYNWQDENFMHVIHRVENLVSKFLSLALIVVIVVSLVDLVRILLKDLFFVEPVGFFDKTLIELFGLFLNILIALELLENITAYLRKHIIQVELVVVTALIAIARKIIIFDPVKYEKNDLISLAVGALALSTSYWLLRRVNTNNRV
jgi:uncharacterized membrane protein (DUF373 family)